MKSKPYLVPLVRSARIKRVRVILMICYLSTNMTDLLVHILQQE